MGNDIGSYMQYKMETVIFNDSIKRAKLCNNGGRLSNKESNYIIIVCFSESHR